MLLAFALTILMMVARPERAAAYDDGEFCKALQQIAVDLNKNAGKMIDSMTRHDFMAVLRFESRQLQENTTRADE